MSVIIPTHDEIRETFAMARDRIAGATLSLETIIEDYPIGRRERGRCKLSVERAKNKGYRTVRTTTNKQGRWCAPKKSTYSNSIYAVVDNWDGEYPQAWICAGLSVSIMYASGAGTTLAKFWSYEPPRRKDLHYVTRTSKPISFTEIMAGAKPEPGEERHDVLKAAPPEEIDAWDVWTQELVIVKQMLIDVWSRCVVQS